MRSLMRRSTAPAALFVVALLAGCASTVPEKKKAAGRVVFPPPPSQPVVEWVGSYGKASDVGAGQGSLSKILVGKEQLEAALVAPTGIAIAPDESLFVVDQRLSSLVILDRARKRFDVFRGEGMGSLAKPIGLAFGPDGTLFVSDATAKAVYAYDRALRFKSAYGGAKVFGRPTGVAVSPDGKRLAVCDSPKNRVHIFSVSDGKLLRTLGSERGGDGPDQLSSPYAVAFDDEGFLYVSDYLNFRIQVFGPDGNLEGTWGHAGDSPGDIDRPRGLNVDSKRGVVYEVDGAFQLVQMFNLDGELLMWFAAPGDGPGQLSLPSGISRRGDLIAVADTMNGRVQLFRFLAVPKD